MRKIAVVIVIFLCNPVLTNHDLLFDNLLETHINSLRNLEKTNADFFILFSAASGMGKTTVAKRIEHVLGAIRINLDKGRNLLEAKGLYPILGSDKERIECIIHYLSEIIIRLKKISKNNLIIVDESVDGMYEELCGVAKLFEASHFLIRFKVSKQTAIERIRSRGIQTEEHLVNIDRWYSDYLHLNTNFDYIFENEGGIQNLDLLLPPLIRKIVEFTRVL